MGPPLVRTAAGPLRADLAAFLDSGLSQGRPAVYVSMGTLAALPERELRGLVAGLAALDSPVLMKLSPRDMPGEPPGQPHDLHSAPARSACAAPACRRVSWSPRVRQGTSRSTSWNWAAA